MTPSSSPYAKNYSFKGLWVGTSIAHWEYVVRMPRQLDRQSATIVLSDVMMTVHIQTGVFTDWQLSCDKM